MKIELDLKKSVEENAAFYYEKAKKLKKKISGAESSYKETLKKIDLLKQERELKLEEKRKVSEKINIKKEWYEKFRWFFSSEGFLCIGGRDATTNDILVKKYTENNDLVFHAAVPGSPFFIVKSEGKKIGQETIEETATATASYSKAWQLGISFVDVYYVNPEQVSKSAPSGQYMGKGSFMILGKKNYLKPAIKLAIGIKEGKIIGGPLEAIKKNSDKYIPIIQGDLKSSDLAKKIKSSFGKNINIEDIQKFLPTGKGKIVKD